MPWSDSNGLVSRRRVYRANVGVGIACPTVFGLYGNVNDIVITEPRDTPTNIVASGVLNEGSKYCFIVRDVDSLNQSETNVAIQSVEIGDLTAPDFTASVSLIRDVGNPENTLVASWTAMAREQDSPLAGASEYLLYISSAVHPALPDSDPCLNGTLYGGSGISTTPYPQGSNVSVNLTSLSPRNNYRICVRARDTSSNISVQAPKALQSTGDVTAPAFAGIQALSFNNGTGSIEYSFVVPAATDVRDYKITTIRTRLGVVNPALVLTKVFSGLSAGQTVTRTFTLAEASLIDNDTVTVRVDVCDNANPSFNSSDNCSATAAEETIVIPDATPPQGFTGITLAQAGTTHRAVEVNWPTPPSWLDYVGFKIYYVDSGSGMLVGLNSSNCLCAGNDCATNPINSCEVTQTDGGAFLEPSRDYEMYVSAFDLVGNQTLQYIPYSGASKITASTRAADIVAPSFNANFITTYELGAKISFDAAIDDQYSVLDMTYEVFRKENATFTCPNTPESSAGGCDGLTPYATVLESALAVEGSKIVYTDTGVTDGTHYYYQLCAIDFASNRNCQTGSIADLNVLDVTAPVITNVDSNKTVGGGSSWQISFNISDNSIAAENLIVKVYKSLSAYPLESNPGTPAFEAAGGTISVNAGTGLATLTDTGTPDVESVYYLIQVQDLNGNKTYVQARDMTPAPVITNVIWPDPIQDNGFPMYQTYIHGLAAPDIRIIGTNLDSITEINDGTNGESTGDIRHCDTSRIQSRTDTEIVCRTTSRVYPTSTYRLYIEDRHNRSFTHVSGSPISYCAYADLNGITALGGDGTAAGRYTICTPDHIKQIGRNADNPNNTEDVIGYFTLGRDIDFTGVTDFKGIPVLQAGDFYMNGLNYDIQNLTIDTSATNEDAAFFLGCVGSVSGGGHFIIDMNFVNATIRTGNGRAAVGILDKTCDWTSGEAFINGSRISGSQIYSNNTAGFWAAEYTATQDHVANVTVYTSTLYSTRPDNTTAVGGMFGKMFGSATLIQPEITGGLSDVSFRPATGQTDAGYNIGGLAGEVDAPFLNITMTANIVNIIGGLENLGGLVGRMRGKADNVTFDDGYVQNLTIDATGSITNARAGLIGDLIYIHNVETVSDLTFNNYFFRTSSITGNDFLGGFIGRVNRAGNVLVENGSFVSSTTISGNSKIGGYLGGGGQVRSTLDDFVATSMTLQGASDVGGFIGRAVQSNPLVITNSAFRNGSVGSPGGSNVGGIVGLYSQLSGTFSQVAVGNSVIQGGAMLEA